MKNVFYIITLLIVSLISNNIFSQDINKSHISIAPVKSIIKGTIVGGNSKYLMLVNQRNDSFHSGVKIPIIDGHFEYELQSSFSEKYTLILGEELENGAFKPINFFVENGKVEFTLHTAQDFDKNKIKGGKLTSKMIAFENEQKKVFEPIVKPFDEELHLLWNSKTYFSEEANAIKEKINGLEQGEEKNNLYKVIEELEETGKAYTPRTWHLLNKKDSISKLENEWKFKYIESNQDLFSYSLLIDEVLWYKQNKKNIDLNIMTNLFSLYSKKYPLHPYTNQGKDIIEGIEMIKVGGLYVDFSAPTIEGVNTKASDLIAGKIALIDLWASWCGPCRVKSKSYIPIYEKYKDKGFVILGVANEFNNTNAFVKAVERDKYTWINLIEMNNKNRIWDKYNISNSGGSTYLVDSKGVILAINPDAKELDKILGEIIQ